ncbi:MAG: ChbG/HpnK family deacetylase [bacterium]|nr:ChbG/HpnK family deacetylase [bacterium]
MTAYLIVNADDFGLTEGTNRAIVDAHQRGLVTSTSLLANGQAFDHAIALARAAPSLKVGVHLTLTEGAPVGDRAWLPGGQFPLSNQPYARALLRGTLPRAAIRAEFHAQVEKVIAAGVQPTHIDGHKYIHLLPEVAVLAAEVAHAFAVPVMRIPAPADPFQPVPRLAGLFALAAMGRLARRAARHHGLAFSDRMIGFMATGHLTHQRLAHLLAQPRPGVTELVCHPAYPTPDLEKLRAAGYRWIGEYDFAHETAAVSDRSCLPPGWTLANFGLLT